MDEPFSKFHLIDKSKANIAWVANYLNVEKQSKDTDFSGLSSASNPKSGTITFVQTARGIDLSSLSVCAGVICNKKTAELLPDTLTTFVVDAPHSSFASLACVLYPQSIGNARRSSMDGEYDVVGGAYISKNATLENDVVIEPGAVIGAHVSIGSGSYIGANATIAAKCQIGRHCSIGSSASLQYSLLGDGVIIHTGARIGQDGFGFVPGPDGLKKMPQLGRVIIQDDVEIGANTTVDRGTLDDTVIGEGTKIDNLVQIGHNVVIGRNCAIAAFAGLSGSSKIGDGCMIGGRVGVADHINVGNGVQLAATSSIMNDVPDGERWAGTPAQPFKAFFREQATLRRLAKPNKTDK